MRSATLLRCLLCVVIELATTKLHCNRRRRQEIVVARYTVRIMHLHRCCRWWWNKGRTYDNKAASSGDRRTRDTQPRCMPDDSKRARPASTWHLVWCPRSPFNYLDLNSNTRSPFRLHRVCTKIFCSLRRVRRIPWLTNSSTSTRCLMPQFSQPCFEYTIYELTRPQCG